jgi:hypothetical protein
MMKLILAALLLAGTSNDGSAHREDAFSSLENDYNLSYDKAERILVFARSKAEFKEARIYVSEKKSAGWSEPAQIVFSDPRYSDSDPWLTPDGKTLYFVSNRPTAGQPDKKDLDIWRSHRTRTGWSEPEHLGDAVNGPGPELGPELHDGILNFASVRKGGQGGLDIYQAAALPGGAFAKAEPIGGPFNSAESESDFTLSADGRTAAFWRSVGGKGILHVATRRGGAWSPVRALGEGANPGPFNFTPSFSRDGKWLLFASTAERDGQEQGMADIYSVRFADVMR